MEFKNADRKEASRLTTEKQTDKEWTYFLTFGFKSDVYGNGTKRRMVDRNTNHIITEYTVPDQPARSPAAILDKKGGPGIRTPGPFFPGILLLSI